MKLSRRNFILSLAGGLIGINLTPLPWKLMDDIAIWTQNWPWVPVPETGRYYYENSVCTLCPGGCGIKVRKVDTVKGQRAIKIEGRTDFPVNPSGICPIGAGALQLLYDESIRFTGPMKRAGLRGSGNFSNISWEYGIDLLVSKINELRKKGRPEKIVAIDGGRKGSTCSILIERFMRAIGSPNYIRISDMEDTYAIASFLMTGKRSAVAFDLENADYILSFGCALIDGWGSPARAINAWSMWHDDSLKKKVKIVQIESRASDTASKATEWIAIKPSTETAFALGIAHVIVKQGLYDKDFVKNHCFGFEDWISANGQIHMGFKNLLLKKYSPEKVSSITGIASDKIVRTAKEFAKASNPIAICGKGKGDLPGSVHEYMAIMSLNALVGSINKDGGVLIHDPLPLKDLPDIELDAIARMGLKKERLDGAGTKDSPFTNSIIDRTAERSDEIEMLLVFSSNPAYTTADGGALKKSLEKIPFIVTFSPFIDDTAMMSDLALPDHFFLEKMDESIWPTGLQYPLYALSKPVVRPIYNTRHTADVIIKMAKKMKGNVAKAFPWNTYEDVLKYRVEGLSKVGGSITYNTKEPVWDMMKKRKSPVKGYNGIKDMWNKLKNKGFWFNVPDIYGKYSFETISGKFEFFSQKLMQYKSSLKEMGIQEKGDEAFMPHYEDMSIETSDYPFKMVPYAMINLSNNWIPSPPFVYKTIFDTQLLKHDSFIDINPKLARKLNLRQGDRVILSSPSGSIKVRVNITETAMPDVIYIPAGFGHTGYDEFIRNKGANLNNIVYGKKDPISGHNIWWDTPVKIVKV